MPGEFEVFKGKISISIENLETTLGNINKLQKNLNKVFRVISKSVNDFERTTSRRYKETTEAVEEATSSVEGHAKANEKLTKEQKKAREEARKFADFLQRSKTVTRGTVIGQDLGAVGNIKRGYGDMIDAINQARQGTLSLTGAWNSFKTVFVGTSSLVDSFTNVQRGLNLATADTSEQYNRLGKAAIGIRTALFGVADVSKSSSKSVRLIGGALDFVQRHTINLNKTQNKYGEDAVQTAQEAAQFNRALADSLVNLKGAAKVAGVNANRELERIASAANEASNRFDKIRTTIASGGKVSSAVLAAQTKAVVQLNNAFQNLENQGIIPTITEIEDLEKQLEELNDQEGEAAEGLREQIKRLKAVRQQYDSLAQSVQVNNQATKQLGIQIDASQKQSQKGIKRLTGGFKKLFGGMKKNREETGRFNLATGKSTSNMSRFNTEIERTPKLVQATTKSMSIMKQVMLGTFAGNVLFGALRGVTGLFNNIGRTVGNFVGGLKQEFFEANNLVQNFEVTLKQMLTGFDEETVSDSLRGAQELIRDVIAKTPFTLASGQQAFQQLITGGLDPREWLEPAADAAAAFNKPMQQLIFAIQRLKAGSKGIGIDMIRDFGIPVQQVGVWVEEASGRVLEFDEVAGQTDEQLKSSGASFKQWAFDAKGSLEQTPTEAIEVLNGFLKQNATIAGASAARSRTLTGVFSNLQDAVTKLVVAFGQPVFQALTDSMTTVLGIVEKLTDTLEPLLAILGQRLGDSLQRLSDNFFKFVSGADTVEDAIEGIANKLLAALKPVLFVLIALVEGDWSRAWGIFLKVLVDAIRSAGEFIRTTGKEAFKWGLDFVAMVAKGLIQGAKTLIRSAVKLIGNIIGSMLRPGSPPKKGPLSDIDKWGAGLIKTFIGSFKLEDTSFLDNILNPIRESFVNMTNGLAAFKSTRGLVRAIIGGINETGQINEDLWKQVESRLGNASKTLKEYVRLQLELKETTKEARDAEAAGFVPQELQDRLEAAQLAVKLKEDELRLEEEIKSKRESAASGAGGGVGAGGDPKKATENQKKELRKRFEVEKKLIEKKADIGLITEEERLQEITNLNKSFAEQALAVGDEAFARERTKSFKSFAERLAAEQKAIALKALKEQIEEERRILQFKYDRGLITQQEFLEGMISLEERFVDESLRLGFLSETDKAVGRLEDLKSQLAELTKIEIDKPAETLASLSEDVTGEFENMMADLEAEMQTASTAVWEDVKTAFGEEFVPIWDEIKSSIGESLGGIFGGGEDGAGGGLRGFIDSLLTSAIEFFNTKWPLIRDNLELRILEMWEWLGSDAGPLARLEGVLDTVVLSIQEWIALEENQLKLQQLGRGIGMALFDGLKLLFTSAEAGQPVVISILQWANRTAISLINSFRTMAVQAWTGFIDGFVEQLRGEPLSPATIEALKAVVSEIATVLVSVVNPFAGILTRIDDFVKKMTSILEGGFIETDSLVGGFIQGFLDFFQGLLDALVGNSIIPDMVNLILDWIGRLQFGFEEKISNLVSNVTGFFNDLIAKINELITKAGELGGSFSGFGGGGLGGLFGGGGGDGGNSGFFEFPIFQKGTLHVPQTGPAIVHEGEAILPSRAAEAFRSFISFVGSGFNLPLIPERASELANLGSTVNNSNSRSLSINNPQFPNVRSGKDARDFMKNLNFFVEQAELRGTVVG